MVHVAPDPQRGHECQPPGERSALDFTLLGQPHPAIEPDVPRGSTWRCDCGRLWVADGVLWEPATWSQRWRHRKAGRA